jgi:hypothetical protein
MSGSAQTCPLAARRPEAGWHSNLKKLKAVLVALRQHCLCAIVNLEAGR